MEIFTVEKDILVLCVKAASFPDGVMLAHQALHAALPPDNQRRYFGISYPDEGRGIIYKAAAEELATDNASNYCFEEFVIKKGKFISSFVPGFCNDVPAIGKAFKELLSHPGIDPGGYCLELYTSPADVICMVPLLTQTVPQ